MGYKKKFWVISNLGKENKELITPRNRAMHRFQKKKVQAASPSSPKPCSTHIWLYYTCKLLGNQTVFPLSAFCLKLNKHRLLFLSCALPILISVPCTHCFTI